MRATCKHCNATDVWTVDPPSSGMVQPHCSEHEYGCDESCDSWCQGSQAEHDEAIRKDRLTVRLSIPGDNEAHRDVCFAIVEGDNAHVWADHDQTIAGDSWECASDMPGTAYAMPVNHPGLVAELQAEGYKLDISEYDEPDWLPCESEDCEACSEHWTCERCRGRITREAVEVREAAGLDGRPSTCLRCTAGSTPLRDWPWPKRPAGVTVQQARMVYQDALIEAGHEPL